VDAHARNAGVAFGTLLASGATLLCCVLPALLVALGAGATMVSVVTAVPQLVWLSERKGLVFGSAGVLLLVSGILNFRARRMPCPANPAAARACTRLRRGGAALFGVALVAYSVGAIFAFVLPRLIS
jgi:hypothetical protein